MTDETLEQSTLEQEPTLKDILNAVTAINQRLGSVQSELSAFKKEAIARFDSADAQFESVRQGIVDINIRLDRVESIALTTRANLSQLAEEVIHNRKVLV